MLGAMTLGRMRVLGGALVTAAVAIGGGSDDAGATTICVPSVAAACPGNGSAVGKTDLEEALSFEGEDGKPDSVLLAAQTYTENASFEPGGGTSSDTFEYTGSDLLTVLGAGVGKSIITSAGSANAFVFNTNYNNTRATTLRDLTIRVPASFPDGLGAGLQLTKEDTLEEAEVVSLNKESDGILVNGAGGAVRNSTVRGEGAQGLIRDGINAGSEKASGVVEDSTIRDASWGLVSEGKEALLTARRVSVLGVRTYGGLADGGNLTIENSVITIDDGIGFFGSAAADPVALNANHVTVVNTGNTDPALEGKKFSSTAGSVTVNVTNSIMRGFSSGYKTDTPFGPGIGTVSVKASYSNLPSNGSSTGGTADFSTGNIDADPLFGADLSLSAGSPSIDAGNPAAGGLATDFLGNFRPRDGNGDGVAVRDQGAFEYQPPKPPPVEEQKDTAAPDTKIVKGPGKGLTQGKAKFAFSSTEAGSHFECKLDSGKPKPCRSPKKLKHLKPGRHVFKVWAIDAAGNKDPTPAKRSFRVPAAG
jgi:hypothetical protein